MSGFPSGSPPYAAIPFYIVDVFTDERYRGNPLAVVMGQFDERLMLAITREMNYSETTFVGPSREDGSVAVRIFTPGGEIPFAGHPTLGTAFVLRERLGLAFQPLVLQEAVGPIPVRTEGVQYWMRQNQPTFQTLYDRPAMAEMLGIGVEDLDPRFPVQTVTTGLPALIVPLRNLDACHRAWLNLERWRALGGLPASVLVFSVGAEVSGHDIHVRVFVSSLGVPEDPATGSANGALAAYLQHYQVVGKQVDVRVEQGVEMGRPSTLHLRAQAEADGIAVEVGGEVQWVAEGCLMEPLTSVTSDDPTVTR